MRQDITIYIFSINISFSSIGQDKSTETNKISNLFVCFCNFELNIFKKENFIKHLYIVLSSLIN